MWRAPANEDLRHQRDLAPVIVSGISCAALCWSLGPAVAVEVEVGDADGLRGWLGTRLLEEGYDLAPDPSTADSTVVVSSHAAGLAVRVTGDGTRSFAVEEGPASVQRLEVLHRVLQGVEATAPPALLSHTEAGIAVRFGGRQHDGLMAAVTNEARKHGVAVRASPTTDDTLVCIAMRGTLAEIGLGTVADGCTDADSVVSVRTGVEQADAAAKLLRRIAPAASVGDAEPVAVAEIFGEEAAAAFASDPTPKGRLAATAGDDDGVLAPMQGPPRAEVRMAADVGVMVRGAADPSIRGRARVGRLRGLGARLEVGVVPSRSETLSVIDTSLMVGPDWQLELSTRVRLSLGALVGTEVHTYATDRRVAADVDWAVSGAIGASVRLAEHAREHVVFHPGLSAVDTHHVFRNISPWHRTAWRVGIAVGFSYSWRIE